MWLLGSLTLLTTPFLNKTQSKDKEMNKKGKETANRQQCTIYIMQNTTYIGIKVN